MNEFDFYILKKLVQTYYECIYIKKYIKGEKALVK